MPPGPAAIATSDERASPAGVYWNPALRTNQSGVLTLTVPLPREPIDLRVLAWAMSDQRFGQGRGTLAVTQPIALSVDPPPFFRAGDRIDLIARIQNSSLIRQYVQATLSAGVNSAGRRSGSADRDPPGQEVRVIWPALVLGTSGVRLSVSARANDGSPRRSRSSARLCRPMRRRRSAAARSWRINSARRSPRRTIGRRPGGS